MKIKIKKILENENIVPAVLTGASVTIGKILKRPGIQASIESLIPISGNPEGEIPSEALVNAEKIVRLLEFNNISPKRIGVDGVPGSGKTSLSRALATLTGMKWRTLDHENLDIPCDLSEMSTIYEHHRLFRTQDIDNFDVIVYIDEPVELSKNKVLKRKGRRSGVIVDVLDYRKLKRVGKLAFEFADEESFEIPDSYIRLKIRPENGYKLMENIIFELENRNITVVAKWHAKEELLFLLAYGQLKKGLSAYIDFAAYNRDLLDGIKAGMTALISRRR